MGNFLCRRSTSGDTVEQAVKECIAICLNHIRSTTSEDINAGLIAYLNDPEIVDLVCKYLSMTWNTSKGDAVPTTIIGYRTVKILGTMYLELHVEMDNGIIYVMDLWPCGSCKCVGFSVKK